MSAQDINFLPLSLEYKIQDLLGKSFIYLFINLRSSKDN